MRSLEERRGAWRKTHATLRVVRGPFNVALHRADESAQQQHCALDESIRLRVTLHGILCCNIWLCTLDRLVF